MQRSLSSLACTVLLGLMLSACGGGGGSDSGGSGGDGDNPALDSGLNGAWVYADGGHYTGSTCGLDPDGFEEYRYTLTFEDNNYNFKFEECNLTSGSSGTFINVGNESGTFKTGDVYGTDKGYKLKKMDITIQGTTYYAGYNITGKQLRLTEDDATNTGLTEALRERELGPEVFLKQ